MPLPTCLPLRHIPCAPEDKKKHNENKTTTAAAATAVAPPPPTNSSNNENVLKQLATSICFGLALPIDCALSTSNGPSLVYVRVPLSRSLFVCVIPNFFTQHFPQLHNDGFKIFTEYEKRYGLFSNPPPSLSVFLLIIMPTPQPEKHLNDDRYHQTSSQRMPNTGDSKRVRVVGERVSERESERQKMDTIIISNELISYATRGTVDTLQNMLILEHMCAISCVRVSVYKAISMLAWLQQQRACNKRSKCETCVMCWYLHKK